MVKGKVFKGGRRRKVRVRGGITLQRHAIIPSPRRLTTESSILPSLGGVVSDSSSTFYPYFLDAPNIIMFILFLHI